VLKDGYKHAELAYTGKDTEDLDRIQRTVSMYYWKQYKIRNCSISLFHVDIDTVTMSICQCIYIYIYIITKNSSQLPIFL